MGFVPFTVRRVKHRTIVFTSLVTPYQIAFFQTESQGWLIVESVIDCVFFIDLVFSFYSAYYNKV